MKPIRFLASSAAAMLACTLASMVHAASATPFDGKTNLVCTVQQLFECDSYAGCHGVAGEVAFPIRHLDVDFGNHAIKIEHLQADLTSPIARSEVIEGKLVLQGTDSGLSGEVDGGGYTMTVNQRYGTMILSIAGQDAAFVATGACISRN